MRRHESLARTIAGICLQCEINRSYWWTLQQGLGISCLSPICLSPQFNLRRLFISYFPQMHTVSILSATFSRVDSYRVLSVGIVASTVFASTALSSCSMFNSPQTVTCLCPTSPTSRSMTRRSDISVFSLTYSF